MGPGKIGGFGLPELWVTSWEERKKMPNMKQEQQKFFFRLPSMILGESIMARTAGSVWGLKGHSSTFKIALLSV